MRHPDPCRVPDGLADPLLAVVSAAAATFDESGALRAVAFFADEDGCEVGTSDHAKERAARRAGDTAPSPNARRHYLQLAARFRRRASKTTRTRRGPGLRHARAPRRPARRSGASSRTSSNDPGDGPGGEDPPPAARSIFDAFRAATPDLTGAERLELFLELPTNVQDAAWQELAEQWAARR